MSRFHSYINSSITIIDSYQKGTPLSLHLKSFFQTDKKFGSRDRKSISSLCYHYYRCFGLLSDDIPKERKMLLSTFLCENEENEMLKELSPELNELVAFDLKDKLEYLGLDMNAAFSFRSFLSPMIDTSDYLTSLFVQPQLFLRIRPGRKEAVLQVLQKNNISFGTNGDETLVLDNGVSVDNILSIDKDVVVQDQSSQRVFDFYRKERDVTRTETLWDCCAASGGKTILLHDICNGNLKITVSDIRENILSNLQLRCKDAGITIQKKFVQDLSQKSGLLIGEKFSLIVCDAPCSGSGTWSRTPEQHYSFDSEMLESFVTRQKQIVNNVMSHLAKDAWFIYVTCSVFEEENEKIVNYIEDNFPCRLMEMKYVKGYRNLADTMFVAYFRN